MLWTNFHSLNFSLDCPLLGRRSITTPHFHSSLPSKPTVEPRHLHEKCPAAGVVSSELQKLCAIFGPSWWIEYHPKGRSCNTPRYCYLLVCSSCRKGYLQVHVHERQSRSFTHMIDVKRGKALRGILDKVTF